MKLLILTRSAWDDANSVGNTMTNFWAGWDSRNIANIYCRAAKPNNNVCQRYYSICEKDLLRSIFNHGHISGQAFEWDNRKNNTGIEDKDIKSEARLYGFFRKHSFTMAQWGQELLWKFGSWRNDKLKQFLADFKPDIVFAPCFAASYPHKILWYIHEQTGAKVILFHADDYLTVNGLGGSILSRFDRRLRACRITRSVKKADLNYCISPLQQKEYSRQLQREMKLLYKGADFSIQPVYKNDIERDLIRIVYIGSTLYGRWKTLGMLAHAIQKINAGNPAFEFLIYSQYQPSRKAERAMVLKGASRFMGKVPASQVSQVLRDANIVLHVESFDENERLATRLSFSTKIVDCFNSGKCVMAIGWEGAASIDYLIKNDAALIATDEVKITQQLENIIRNPAIICEYAQKAWECGKRNHQIDLIQKRLHEDFNNLINNNKNEDITN